jgi:hypothetical protein
MARVREGESPGQLNLEDLAQTVELTRELAPTQRTSTRAGSPRRHQSARELLQTPDALLTRTHLRELGLERRAVDAVFRILPVVALPGYSRPMIRAQEYLALIARSTYNGDRVRP